MSIQLPTRNIVTQTAAQHGYPATDYAARPDPKVYAPVSGMATARGNPNNNPTNPNDCGWMIEQISDDGKHKVRLCHNTRTDWVQRHFVMGDEMATIGYSGFTIPAGPSGAHIHLVLFKKTLGVWRRVGDPDAYIKAQRKENDMYYGHDAKFWYNKTKEALRWNKNNERYFKETKSLLEAERAKNKDLVAKNLKLESQLDDKAIAATNNEPFKVEIGFSAWVKQTIENLLKRGE